MNQIPRRTKRASRTTTPLPVLPIQQKSSSGSGGWLMLLLLLAAAGGGWFIYNNQQKNEAALALRQQRMEENARKAEEAERQRDAFIKGRHDSTSAPVEESSTTDLGSTEPPTSAASTTDSSASRRGNFHEVSLEGEETGESGSSSALGSTSMEGGFSETDTSAPVYDLAAEGKAAKSTMNKLYKAMEAAGKDNTFHDLQADLKRAFDVAHPGLFGEGEPLPAFPDKDEKLLRLAQGVYVCLQLAAELEAQDSAPREQHARFVNWLMKEKAKAARSFTYGLDHCGISDTETATQLLERLRTAYLKDSSTAFKKLPAIIKAGAK